MQPPLAGTPVAIGDPAELLGWVMFGRRPAALPAGVYHGVMPQFGYLSDDELATILTHVRSSFGNHAPPVTPAMVAAARAAHRAG
jgi:mono/diheme cytochrome c family protein